MSHIMTRLMVAGGFLAAISFAAQARAGDEGSGGRGVLGAQCVALTFDDGPDPVLTPRLLDILAAEHVKATFFVIGRKVAQWPEIVQRAYREGHEIGNHSWSHPVLPSLSSPQVESELARTDAAIQAAIGIVPAVIRPPYGSQSARIAQIAAPRPLVLWDTDTLDWRYKNSERVTRVADHTPFGTIVLMHDIHPTTIDSVSATIAHLRERGAGFATVSEFLQGRCGRDASIAFRRAVAPVEQAAGNRLKATETASISPSLNAARFPVNVPGAE